MFWYWFTGVACAVGIAVAGFALISRWLEGRRFKREAAAFGFAVKEPVPMIYYIGGLCAIGLIVMAVLF